MPILPPPDENPPKLDLCPGYVLCLPGKHCWKHEQCMVCSVCAECTGYGASCVSANRPDRLVCSLIHSIHSSASHIKFIFILAYLPLQGVFLFIFAYLPLQYVFYFYLHIYFCSTFIFILAYLPLQYDFCLYLHIHRCSAFFIYISI